MKKPSRAEWISSAYGPKTEKVVFWAVLASAFAFRFAALSLKPPHADEGVNGFFVNELWQKGFFSYDPSNYHGPLLFYLFQIAEKIFGFGIGSFRIVTASFSLMTVWLVLNSTKTLGRYGALLSGIVLALSPAMVFYGRSAIHEPVFVFFQVLWMIGFLNYLERPERSWLAWTMVGALGCVLLKETFAITALSFFAGWLWASFLIRIRGGQRHEPPPNPFAGILRDRKFSIEILTAAAIVWLLLFTGFFHNWRGAGDFFGAFFPWLRTGVGATGHEKPFAYWLRLLLRYEWAVIPGLALSCAGLFSCSWKVRFLSCFALINGIIYSAVPYKTPWCIISILWPFAVLAGIYIEMIWGRLNPQVAAVFFTVALIAVAHGAFVNYRLNFVNYANGSEPYVYVQTKKDYKVLEGIINKKIALSPDARNMDVRLDLKEASWPLPWFFSRFPNLKFGGDPSGSDHDDIVMTEEGGTSPGRGYVVHRMELREARGPIYVYLRKSAFGGIDLPGFAPVKD